MTIEQVHEQLKALALSLLHFERRVMSQLDQLQQSVDTLTKKASALIGLTNTLHADLIALQGQTTDSATQAALGELVNKITATNAQIDAALAADAEPQSGATTSTEATTSTTEAAASTGTGTEAAATDAGHAAQAA